MEEKVVHALVGLAIEIRSTHDQLDMVNLRSFELLGRLCQMIKKGTLATEGFDWVGECGVGSHFPP